MGDTALFNGSADITTKEILKRYGAIAKSGHGPHRIATNADPPSSRGEGRGNVPIATRVDTDPYQATAWEKESSVRHVEGSGVPGPVYPTSNNNTPPQTQHEFVAVAGPSSPYRHRPRSSESQVSPGLPNRNSGHSNAEWTRPAGGHRNGLGVN